MAPRGFYRPFNYCKGVSTLEVACSLVGTWKYLGHEQENFLGHRPCEITVNN